MERQHETRYVDLPENLYYDLSDLAKSEQEKADIREKQSRDGTDLIDDLFGRLAIEAYERLVNTEWASQELAYRWLDSRGKNCLSGRVRWPAGILSEELPDPADSGEIADAIIDAMNDTKVPLYLVFEAGGRSIEFCLRFK